MQQQQQAYQNQKREGDITVESSESNKKRFSKDAGEYIDFEEVK